MADAAKLAWGAFHELFRDNIERYDFAASHVYHKTNNMSMDLFMFGGNELALVMWYGDVQGARAGWADSSSWTATSLSASRARRRAESLSGLRLLLLRQGSLLEEMGNRGAGICFCPGSRSLSTGSRQEPPSKAK